MTMKRIFIIVYLLGLILNSYSQYDSEINRELVNAEQELIVRDTPIVNLIIKHAPSGTARDAGSGMSLDGNNMDLGGTLDTDADILGAANSMSLGTSGSKLNIFQVNTSGNLIYNSDADIIFNPSGTSWTLNGAHWISAGGDTLATNAVVQSLIAASEAVLPYNWEYTFNSSIVDARPGIGLFRLNNATLANVTQIYIDYFDADGTAKNDFLAMADTGSAVAIQTDVNNYALYKLTSGYNDAGNYYKYNVTYQSHNGTISGLNTIDLDISNSTGSGGGLADSTFSVVTVLDTLKIDTDFELYQNPDFDRYEMDFGSYSARFKLNGDFIFNSGVDSMRYSAGILRADGSGFTSENAAYFTSFNGGYALLDSVGFTDGSGYITGIDTSGNVTADTGTFNVIVLGGSEPVDTVYDSKYVMENTVIDSIQVEKTIRYNESEGVHEFLTGKDEVVWQGALEDLFQFYNSTGQTITNGTPLYYSGVNGDSILTCDYATAAIGFTVLRYAGLATGNVPDGMWGFGNERGKVRDYNTTGLSQIGAVFLGNDSLPTMTKPAYPSEVLILGGVIEVAVNGILYHDPSFALRRELESRDYSFTTQGILAGTYYKGGYYDWSATDANLDEGSTTQAYGTISVAYSAHASVVIGGAGSTDAGVVGLRVTGTSIDDNGVRTATDADTIITDITAVATDEYYESKKWIGIVTYELITISGSPTTYSLDFNYGYAKYEDANNNDYYLVGLEVVGLAGANDTDFNIELLHHISTGWTYAASGFIPGNGSIASWNTDLAPEDNLSSGSNFAWKRSNLSQFIDGNGSEGAIFRIITGSSAAVQSMDLHILIALD